MTLILAVLLWLGAVALPGGRALAQQIPTPRDALGFDVGADRRLADWGQIVGYLGRLAEASPAVELDTLGASTLGKPFVMATISTPENIGRLREIRNAQALLADPRRLSPEEERRLVASQPAVLLVSCNIHATEIASAQMAMELAHRLATNDTLQRALRDVVVLLIPSMNPDGEQMVVEWYREGVGTRWEGGPIPWLYHHYVGHDNNRDWYMVTQKETQLVTDLLYRQWFPQVVYDVHQMGSEGARLFVPPFVDPINPNVDPLIVRQIAHIGTEMALALEARGKSGVADGVIYDLWWHGGMRSTPTRHNMVGVLTEAASVRIATPITQDTAKLRGHERGLPQYERRMNFPSPWPGGAWRLRDIVDYELIASEALIRMLSQQREEYVRNFVQLGRKQVKLGETQAPYAYVIPAGQRDPAAVGELLRVLRAGGVEVLRATADFAAEGRRFAPGSWVVRMNQPYRAHAKDLLEVQRFPHMERWPGGPPERPYDVAGWTLPLQMGVDVVEMRNPLPPVATIPEAATADDDLSDCRRAAGTGSRRSTWMSHDLRNTGSYRRAMRAVRCGMELDVEAEGVVPPGRRLTRAPRIALYKSWTANMDEGWTRWVLEQFEIPFRNVGDSAVKAGRLRDQFDVLIVPDMSLRDIRSGMADSLVPARYAGGLGASGIEAIKTFVGGGGTLVLLDRASELATAELGVPAKLITVPRQRGERASDRQADTAALRGTLFAPGSVLRVLVDSTHPVAWGMPDTAAVYFTNSVTFDVAPRTAARVIARYPERSEDILLSGFLDGGSAIAGKVAALDAPVGRGRVIMFGFRPQYRGQSYGTFRMLFNALLFGGG